MLNLLLTLALACATGPTPQSLQADAEAAMGAKDWAGAAAKADEALKLEAVSKDAAQAWRFELIRLNALAAAGKGKEVQEALTRLSGTYARQLTASLYHSLAEKVKAGGDNAGYIELLDAGKKKFPEDASFQAAIDAVKNAPMDPEEVEKLKALGYL